MRARFHAYDHGRSFCKLWATLVACAVMDVCYAQTPSPALVWTWIGGSTAINVAPNLVTRFQPNATTQPSVNDVVGSAGVRYSTGDFCELNGQLWLALPNTVVASFNTTSQLWTWYCMLLCAAHFLHAQ
jgi:hypothetical protein